MRAGIAIASAFCGIFVGGSSFAQTTMGGAAYLPYWECYSATATTTHTNLHIKNISSSNLTLTVTFYGNTGAVVTSGITTPNFSGTTIAAGAGVFFTIQCSTWNFGVAKIEWSGASAQNPLLAFGHRLTFESGERTALGISVNGDKPF